MVVNFRHEGQIAIVTVDNPPVNALSKAVRVGLLDALKKSEALKSVEAVLLMCAGRTFIAGADISEFAKPLEAPYLFYIINEIEKATKPWIAVLHGTVLGGGLEIALGCHYRIATSTTKLGLPEVTLGLIPGAGGTVRLPRLIGAVAALEMVTSGKPVIAQRAMDIGLIDKVSKTNIKDMAFEFVIGCILKPLPQPIIDRPFPVNVDKVKWANQIERICASSHGQNAPLAAIRCIENALRLTPLDALSIERDIFLEQMSDPQSKALQYIFFAERSSGKLPEIKGIKPRPLDQVGIVGSGEMSSGVAAVCLIFGLNLIMIEPDDKAADSARKLIRNKLCYAKKQSVITDAEIKLMLDRLKFGEKYNELSSVDFVIDAMFENSEQKRTVFAELEQVMRPDAIIARIASHRDPNIFSVPMHDPSRVIGLHFFLSAYSTKLMELVVTTSASPDVLATGVAFGKKLQKITIPTAICGGSIGNRISYGCLSECYNMIDAGAFPWEIDQAMRSYGFSIGIFEMEDLLGLDVSLASLKHHAVAKSFSGHSLKVVRALCEVGRLGHRSGKGWYDYASGDAQPDKFVEEIILREAGLKSTNRTVISEEQIISRVLKSMRDAGLQLLSEGIAKKSSDIDVVMVNGYGFPRYHGGPMFSES